MSLSDSLNNYIKTGNIKGEKLSAKATQAAASSLDDTLNSYIKTGKISMTRKATETPAAVEAPKETTKSSGLNKAGQSAFFGNPYQEAANKSAENKTSSIKNEVPKANIIEPVQIDTNISGSTPRVIKPEEASALNPVNLIADLAKGIYNQYANPSEATIQAEQALGYTPKEKAKTGLEKVERVVSAPIRTIGKAFVRTFAPALEPTAETFGQAIATGEISDKVANGELPPEALDTLTALNKKWYQVVGDSTQAVLVAYTPSLLKSVSKNSVLSGLFSGLEAGTTFGAAQVLSTGEKDPAKIAEILLKSAIAGSLFGTATGYLGKVGTRLGENAAKKVQALDAIEIINQYADNPITKASSLEDIKAAYYSAAKKTHPDKGGDPLVFSDVAKAYEFLTGKQKQFNKQSAETNQPVKGLLEKETKAVAKTTEVTKSPKTTIDNLNNKIAKAVENDQPLDVLVEDLSKAKNELNTYIESNKTPVIDYKASAEINAPKLNISTVKLTDGKYLNSIEASYSSGTLLSPFDQSQSFKTQEAAILDAKNKVKSWAESQQPINETVITELKNIVNNLENKNVPEEATKQYPTIHEGGKVKMVEGKPVKIVDGVETFLHQGDGGWIVSEASTGRYIAESRSVEGVLAKAAVAIDDVGVDKFKELIKTKKIDLPKYLVGDTVKFDGKTKTITSILPQGKDTKYELTGKNGKTIWTNQLYLDRQNAPTQKTKVEEVIKEKPKTIKEIAEETKILEPNVRRILGVGAKEGTFERVDKGVYRLKKDGQDIAFIHPGDSVEILPRLAKEGFKADMIFLDIPYKTGAVTGGNRGAKFNFITPDEFKKVAQAVSDITVKPSTPVFYMYSQAKSGLAQMAKYNEKMLEVGFKPVAKGEYTKLQKDGVTRTRNMRGEPDYPEGIILFTKSGEFDKALPNLNFKMIRPKGYQTEKPAEMLKQIIELSTNEGDVVLDPFAGSGVTAEQAVLTGRKAVAIEKSEKAIEEYIKPRVEKAAKTRRVLPSTKAKEETPRFLVKGNNLTLKTFDFLRGKETVSRQYISDLTNRNDIKQSERDVIREVLDGITDNKINVNQFINDVKSELLPLKILKGDSDVMNGESQRYEFVTLPADIRGGIANYSEHIFESPVKTSAGDIHFKGDTKKYFGHTRIEDMAKGEVKVTGKDLYGNPIYDIPDQSGNTNIRRVIEVQSDLYQKGRLERERTDASLFENLSKEDYKEYTDLSSRHQVMNLNEKDKARMFELINKAESNLKESTKKLTQYNDPTAHFRMVREEVKLAAKDKVSKLQFPTGETAMKIEGLNKLGTFKVEDESKDGTWVMSAYDNLSEKNIKKGLNIFDRGRKNWIVTEVLEDGNFKALPKDIYDRAFEPGGGGLNRLIDADRGIKAIDYQETFNVSGNIDKSNPIYKFYENTLSRYLKNKYDAKLVTDNKGVSWYQIDIKPEYATQPVEAFSIKNVSEFTDRNQGIKKLDDPFDGEKLFNRLQKDMRRLGLNFDISLFDKIYTGEMASKVVTRPGGIQTLKVIPEEAAGVTYANTIALSRVATKFTEKHELIHIISQNMSDIPAFAKYDKNQLLKEAGEVYGQKYQEENLEEVLARGFEDFVYRRKTFFGQLKSFFEQLLYQVKQIINFTRKVNLKSFYEDVLYSKAKTTTEITPTRRFGKETTALGKKTLDFTREGARFSKKPVAGFNADEYVKEKTQDAKQAEKADFGGLRGELRQLGKEAKSKLVDFTAPIEDTLASATKRLKLTLKPSEDIHNQIDKVLRTPTMAGQFVKDTGFDKVIREVDNIDNLDQYLIAKHAIELEEKGIKTGRDLEKDAQLIEAFKDKYESYAQKVIEYSRQILDYAVSRELINANFAAKLKEIYPNYVPFNRIFNEVERNQIELGSNKSVASLSKQSIIQKISGSEREISSPIISLLDKTNKAFKQGEKNLASKILISYKDLEGNPFGIEEVTKDRQVNPGEETISYLDKGIKRRFIVNPDIARAAKALDVQKLNILGQIFAFPVRVARLGITSLNVPFVVSNILKDQVTATINSNNALKTSILNPKIFLKSFIEVMKPGEISSEIARSGGGGTSYDISRNQAPLTIKRIRSKRNIFSKVKYTVTNPLELIRAAEDLIGKSEEFTRTKQYIGAKEALLKQGLPESEARIGAARAYNEDTVNFARRGEWGQVLNSAWLYLNAGIQGTRNLLRNLKSKPGKTALKIAIAALFPMALATIYNLKDEKRKKVYDDIPEWEKENNIIIIPPDTTMSGSGKYNVIKIPVSQEVANLTNFVRKGIEAINGGDPVGFKDIADSIFGTVTPFSLDVRKTASQLTIQAIKPTVETLANTYLYSGNPMVSKFMENLPPEQQVYEDTSGTARKIGAALNVSPLKVEGFLKETFGELALQVENLSDRALNALGIIPEEQIGGRGIIEGTLRRFATASGGAIDQETKDELSGVLGDVSGEVSAAKTKFKPKFNEIQQLIEDGKESEAQAIVDGLSDSEYVIYKSMKKTEKTKQSNQMKIQVYPTYTKVQQLIEAGNQDEAQKIVDNMSDAEYKAYESLKSSLKKGEDVSGVSGVETISSKDEGGFISGIALYAKAIGADPVTAFNRIFTGQRITKLVNGTIIVERMPLAESQKVKKSRGGLNADWKLDHLIPLELGGSNNEKNLILVPTEAWASWTNTENELGRQLKAGTITKKEAWEKIREVKKDYIE